MVCPYLNISLQGDPFAEYEGASSLRLPTNRTFNVMSYFQTEQMGFTRGDGRLIFQNNSVEF